jgi:hypothetical protein
MKFWPLYRIGLLGRIPCSLPNAISDPVKVRYPSTHSNPIAVSATFDRFGPCR